MNKKEAKREIDRKILDREMVSYIKRNPLNLTPKGIAKELNVYPQKIYGLIKSHRLQKYIYNPEQDIINYVNANKKEELLISGISKKFHIDYRDVKNILRRNKLTSHCSGFYNHRRKLSHDKIIEWCKEHSISEVSRMARNENLLPQSRQGIYDLLNRHSLSYDNKEVI